MTQSDCRRIQPKPWAGMWRRGGAVALWLALALTAAPGVLRAQILSGVNGTVYDASGAAVGGATVTAANQATGVVTRGVTTTAGTYILTGLVPGLYTVTIAKPGFKKFSVQRVQVLGETSATVNATLQVGSTSTTVEVQSGAIALQTSQPQLGTTIDKRLMSQLPIEVGNAYGGVGPRARAIESFMFLAPGVSNPGQGSSGGEFSHNVNGGVSFSQEVMFDGVAAVQAETQGFQQYIDPPYELVSQTRLMSTTFSAQYGLSSSVAAYTFNSGTNQFHGDAFEFLRNSALDARNPNEGPCTAAAPDNCKAPPDLENNFGFSLGGPVELPGYNGHGRTFFYTSFDWYRLNQSAVGYNSVPTAAERAGDFSGLLNTANGVTTGQIFMPQNASSACMAAAGVGAGQAFPGNKIPQACMSPLSLAVLKNVPNPDRSGFQNNITSEESGLPYREFNWGFTLDHTITDSQSIHFTFWRNRYTQYSLSNLMTGIIQSGTYQPDLGTGAFLNYSDAITPNLVMTAGFGWMGEINNQFDMGAKYAFPGASGVDQLPNISFQGPGPDSGFVTGWGQAWQQSINRKLGISIDNNWLWSHGANTWNFGFEIRRAYQDDGECQQCLGNFYFSSLTTSNGDNNTADALNVNNTGNAVASFLLGLPDNVYRQFSRESRLRNFYFASYAQDNLKLTRDLTLDLGIRWDIPVPFTEMNNDVVFFDPTLKDPAANGHLGAITQLGSCSTCAGYDRASIDWKDFAPRLGFSYQINNRTVLNGGFSMSYLDGGSYEFGTNKVAVDYGNDLEGFLYTPSSGTNISSYGSWDGRVLGIPPSLTVSPGMLDGQSTVFEFSQGDNVTPYMEQWSLGIQRQLPWDTFLSMAYVGNRGVHLSSQLIVPDQISPQDLNLYKGALYQPLLNASGQPAVPLPYANFLQTWCGPMPAGGYNQSNCSVQLIQALKPYPQYGNVVNTFDQSGSSAYNALQVQVQKRFSQGLTFLVAYTWSKNMTNVLGDSGFTVFDNQALDTQNQREAWAISNNDQPDVLDISAVYDLPFGAGRRFANGGNFFDRNVAGGWRVSSILSYVSGTPLGFGQGQGNPLGNGMGNPPNLTGQPLNLNYALAAQDHPCSTSPSGICGPTLFNTKAFATTQPYVFGNAAPLLTNFRYPFQPNEDLELAKSVSFTERLHGTLGFEFFNVFNRVIPCSPDTTVTDAQFGQVSQFDCGTPRQGQVDLRLTF